MTVLKVVGFDTRDYRKQEVVEMARELLAAAEAGEIVDLAYSACKPDGTFETGYTPTDNAPLRLGAVSRLQYRLNTTMSEIDE